MQKLLNLDVNIVTDNSTFGSFVKLGRSGGNFLQSTAVIDILNI